jgi:hypothetical protein
MVDQITVMCPDRKLLWLKKRKEIDARKLKAIKKLVLNRWQTTYSVEAADVRAPKKKRNQVIFIYPCAYCY